MMVKPATVLSPTKGENKKLDADHSHGTLRFELFKKKKPRHVKNLRVQLSEEWLIYGAYTIVSTHKRFRELHQHLGSELL